ncbi:MAG: energy-coupling factor ABC transporter ATP-binding protein [Desulfarculus sp.]|nr:energy-coupling factor ABC transporter ATP-binding protein [Desulfarculus sp.]
MSLIRMTGIHFAYPGRPPVFAGLDFSLEEGQRVGILGPNGAGKSTLFLLAMGLLSAQAGAVELFGQAMRREADFAPLRTRLGYCFQDPDDQLFCPTVLEDVAFGPLNQGLERGQALERAHRALAELGLDGFAERVTYQLSGGEKRLVTLATVLALRPQALLLDEPTAGLDPQTQARFESVLQKSQLPWAVISHDHGFLRRLCHQVLELSGGRLTPLA